jgi:hypothetical protein
MEPSSDTDIAARFRAAVAAPDGRSPTDIELLPVRLARAAVAVLPIDGAGLSLFNDDFRVPVGASDDVATLAERLQFTQGEGPCLDAVRDRRIQIADLQRMEERWPSFARELFRRTPYRAIISLPLTLTATERGAMDLYLPDPGRLDAVGLADASAVTDEVVAALTDRTATIGADSADRPRRSDGPAPAWLNTPVAHGRTNVWIAMGIVMTRFELTASDAMALLRSYAYGHDMVLDDLAAAVVDGTVDLGQLQT